MDWSALDLRKAAILKKEVDVALVALAKVQNDPIKKDLLVMSIQSRIDELDSFCSSHEADDRIVLFEKQQLRLRKAIQTHQLHQPPMPPQFSTKVSIPSFAADNISTNSPLSLSALNGQPSPSVQRRSAPSPANSSSSPTKTVQSSGRSQKSIPPFNNTVRPQHPHSHTLASVVLPPPPTEKIYDWEAGEGKEQVKKRLFLDGSSYCPTNKPGMYVREIREPVTETEVDENGMPIVGPGFGFGAVQRVVGAEELPDSHIDFQIILTAEEMSTLISRRRIMSREDITHAKSQMVSANVHISTPYIDQSRVMRDHFRPNHPEKWVAKDDIRPNK